MGRSGGGVNGFGKAKKNFLSTIAKKRFEGVFQNPDPLPQRAQGPGASGQLGGGGGGAQHFRSKLFVQNVTGTQAPMQFL